MDPLKRERAFHTLDLASFAVSTTTCDTSTYLRTRRVLHRPPVGEGTKRSNGPPVRHQSSQGGLERVPLSRVLSCDNSCLQGGHEGIQIFLSSALFSTNSWLAIRSEPLHLHDPCLLRNRAPPCSLLSMAPIMAMVTYNKWIAAEGKKTTRSRKKSVEQPGKYV